MNNIIFFKRKTLFGRINLNYPALIAEAIFQTSGMRPHCLSYHCPMTFLMNFEPKMVQFLRSIPVGL